MKKMTLIGLHDDRHRLLARLMEIGVVDIVDAEIDEELSGIFSKEINKDDLIELDGKLHTLETAISVLKPYDDRKKPIFKVRKDMNHHDYMGIVLKRHDVLAIARNINSVKEGFDNTKSAINRDANSILTLNSWSALSIPMETETTRNTLVTNGMVPSAADIDGIRAKIEEEELACEFVVTGSDSDQSYLTVYTHTDDEQSAMSILKRNGFAVMSFSGYTGSVDENIGKLRNDIEDKKPKRTELKTT